MMSDAVSTDKLIKEGKSAYQNGDYLAAVRAFETAQQVYLSQGNSLDAAEMANNCSVAYLQAGDGQAALKAVEGTDVTFAEAGDLRRQGMALGNLGSALEAVDRTEDAVEAYLQSASLLEKAGEDQLRANVMHSLSMLQFRTGKQLQALASMQNGLQGVKRPTPKQSLLKKLISIPVDMLTKNKKPSNDQ
jgi:tetratricopeptide (TPR) repeat protein